MTLTLRKTVPVTVDERPVTIDTTPNNIAALVAFGVALFNAGKAGSALEAAEQALAEYPTAGVRPDELALKVVEGLRRGQLLDRPE
jgi:hypothetical protein